MKKILKNYAFSIIVANSLLIMPAYGILNKTSTTIARTRALRVAKQHATTTKTPQISFSSTIKLNINKALGYPIFTPHIHTDMPYTSIAKKGNSWLGYIAALLGLTWGMHEVLTKKDTPSQEAQTFLDLLGKYKKDNELNEKLTTIIRMHNPEDIAIILNEVKKNKTNEFYRCLYLFTALNTHSKDKLIVFIKQNFLELSIWNGNIILNIMKNNPLAQKELIPMVKQHFLTLGEHFSGFMIIKDIMEDYAHESDSFLSLVEQNFSALSSPNNSYGYEIINKIINVNPNASKTLCPLAKQNFQELISHDNRDDCSIINTIINKNPDATKQLTPVIIANFHNLIKTNNGSQIINNIIEKNPDAIKQLTPVIIADFHNLIKNNNGSKIIKASIENNPTIASELALLTLQSDSFNPTLFDDLMKYVSCNETIETAINAQKNKKNNDIDSFLTLITYCEHCKETALQQTQKEFDTPSYNHIKYNREAVIRKYVQYFASQNFASPIMKKVFAEGMQTEQQLTKEGYIPFVHGRRRTYDFLTQLDMFLGAITTKQKPNNDFIRTHIKKLKTNLEQEKQVREKLIKNGNLLNSKNDPEGTNNRQRLLFLNCFMLGNTNHEGSNSFLYMLNNTNADDIAITIKDIFIMHDLEPIYNEFAQELQKLHNYYNDISEYGQILQIGIKPRKVQKSVYLTGSGGAKISSEDIINTLKNPKDRMEFAFINTFDGNGGLNPKNMKIKILDPAKYDPISEAKKAECNKQRDALFATIESRIKERQA